MPTRPYRIVWLSIVRFGLDARRLPDSRESGNPEGTGTLAGVEVRRPWERGRPAGGAALARGGALILAFSHKGRRDPPASIYT